MSRCLTLLLLALSAAFVVQGSRVEVTVKNGTELATALRQFVLDALARAGNGSSTSSDQQSEYILHFKGVVNTTGIMQATPLNLTSGLQGTFVAAGENAASTLIDFGSSTGFMDQVSRCVQSDACCNGAALGTRCWGWVDAGGEPSSAGGTCGLLGTSCPAALTHARTRTAAKCTTIHQSFEPPSNLPSPGLGLHCASTHSTHCTCLVWPTCVLKQTLTA